MKSSIDKSPSIFFLSNLAYLHVSKKEEKKHTEDTA